MKKINIPGFVAERSLKSNRTTYVATFSTSQRSQVIPQMMSFQCVEQAAEAWNRCLRSGSAQSGCNYIFDVDLFYCRYP
jgi:hypothetical protein